VLQTIAENQELKTLESLIKAYPYHEFSFENGNLKLKYLADINAALNRF